MADDAGSVARIEVSPPPPQARRFTREEFDKIIAAGVFGEGERVELHDGEIITMMGEGPRHVNHVDALFEALLALLPQGLIAYQRTRLDLPDGSEVYPDIMVVKAGTRLEARTPETALLIIEIADTSLAFDRRRKAARYAAGGFAEYWVLDVNEGQFWVHRGPKDNDWRQVFAVDKGAALSPLFAPDRTLKAPEI